MKALLTGLVLAALVSGCICCDRGLHGLGESDVAAGVKDRGLHGVGEPDVAAAVKTTVASTARASTTAHVTSTLADIDETDLEAVIDSGLPYYCTFKDRKTLSETWNYELWSRDWMYYTEISLGRGRKTKMIFNRDYQYVWDASKTQGIKYPVNKIKGMTGHVDVESHKQEKDIWYLVDLLNPRDIKDVQCKKDNVPEGKFKPPERVRFKTGKSRYDYTDND